MTDNATPTPRRTYSRRTRYPARLAVMLDQEMRDKLDELVADTGASLGEVTRALIADGLMLNGVPVETLAEVQRLARAGGESESQAITTMLNWAIREIERRQKRDRMLAGELAVGMAEAGFAPDAVTVE